MKIVYEGVAHTPEWFAARRGKITASRAANILASSVDGAEPGYKSKLQEWHDLKAELSGEARVDEEEEDFDEDRADRMEEGTFSEPLHRLRLGRALNETLVSYDKIIQDDEYPWLLATPDTLRESGAPAELKKLGGGSMLVWKKGGVPFMHVVQLGVQQRILRVREGGIVSGLALWRGAFAPLSVEYTEYDLGDREEHFLLGVLEGFWDSVQRDIPPEPTAEDYEVVRAAAKPKSGQRCKLPMTFYDKWQALERRREAVSGPYDTFIEDEKAFKAEVITVMGAFEAELGLFDDGTGFVLKGKRMQRMKGTGEYFISKPSCKFSATAGWK